MVSPANNGDERTASLETTRETIRTSLAAGELKIPEFAGEKSELSSPPAFILQDNPLTPYQSLRYRLPFGPPLCPPNPELSFKVQILEHTRQWIFLASSIADDKKRGEVLDRAFDKYQMVWFEALRIGYRPYEQAIERKAPAAKSRKRDIPPHVGHVFIPEKFKDRQGRPYPLIAISAGELEEAGITEEQVRKRAHDGDYAQANEIFSDVYEDLDREVVQSDWSGTSAQTKLNPSGRDLFFYSLYVAQLYEMSLHQLRHYQMRFKTASQIRNGQRNIDKAEQERRIFLALALELSELESSSDTSESSPDEDPNVHECSEMEGDTVKNVPQAEPQVPSVGLKRLAESDDENGRNNSEVPVKRQRLSIDTHKEHTAVEGTPEIGSTVTDFQGTKDALLSSVLSVTERDEFGNEYNKGPLNDSNGMAGSDHIDARKENTGVETTPEIGSTVTDLQGAKDALFSSSLPLTGLPLTEGDELGKEYNKGPLGDRNVTDKIDHIDGQVHREGSHNNLELSVQTDGDGETLRKPDPDSSERHALIVKLKIGHTSDWDPAQFSCNAVFREKGFRYRYMQDSTLAERRAADDALDRFVCDRVKQKSHNARYGQYEAICLPDDPERKTIVHGIWDTRDGQPIENAAWFYTGNGKHPTFAIDESDDIESEDDDGPEQFEVRRQPLIAVSSSSSSTSDNKKKVTFAPTATEEQLSNNSIPKPQRKRSAINAKVKTAIRLRVNADKAQRNSNGNGNSKRGQTANLRAARAKTNARANNRGVAGARGGQRGRPKRANTTRNNYSETEFNGESDEEYNPGHSD